MRFDAHYKSFFQKLPGLAKASDQILLNSGPANDRLNFLLQ
jgi:hypothetical protein